MSTQQDSRTRAEIIVAHNERIARALARPANYQPAERPAHWVRFPRPADDGPDPDDYDDGALRAWQS